MVRFLAIAFLCAAAFAASGCGGDSGDDGGGTTSGASTEQGGGSGGGGSSGTGEGLTAADLCDLLTTAEIEAAVGNSVEDGAPETPIICDWESDPDEVSVALFLQPLPSSQICEAALTSGSGYERDDSFDVPAFTSYLPALGGTADVIVCLERGQLQLTVTGGLDDADNEDDLRDAATELMRKALSRL